MRQVYKITGHILFDLANSKSAVLEMAEALRTDETLFSLCESDSFSDRLILYANTTNKYSLRLHFRVPSGDEQPHNHRSSFSTLILAGSYKHSLYNLPDSGNNPSLLTAQDIKNIAPFLIREEKEGCMYSLHHDVFHSTLASDNHISLVIKGPAVKERLLFIDREKFEARWLYSRDVEERQNLRVHEMTKGTLETLIEKVARL